MTQYILITLIFVLYACGTTTTKGKITGSKKNDTTIVIDSISGGNIVTAEAIDENYATYFLVIADTNQNYSILRSKMFRINKQLNIHIDTLGRYYNKTKDLIALPDDDEDEIYAGDYFPRRYPTEHLSLEYLSFYKPHAGEKAIALIYGIYEAETTADSALVVLKRVEKSAFKFKANVYIGCMH